MRCDYRTRKGKRCKRRAVWSLSLTDERGADGGRYCEQHKRKLAHIAEGVNSMERSNVTARLFEAKDYRKAMDEKERTGGIIQRVQVKLGAAMFPMYEVRYLPIVHWTFWRLPLRVEMPMYESLDDIPARKLQAYLESINKWKS